MDKVWGGSQFRDIAKKNVKLLLERKIAVSGKKEVTQKERLGGPGLGTSMTSWPLWVRWHGPNSSLYDFLNAKADPRVKYTGVKLTCITMCAAITSASSLPELDMMLTKYNDPVNQRGILGATLIIISILMDEFEGGKFLLAYRANPKLKFFGKSALDWAKHLKRSEMLDLLTPQ